MEQQTIIITGASDGIGAAAARQLSAKSERVVLVGRSPAKTAAIADELGAPHHLADYADLDQVGNLASELRATYPRIDVLANNAGGIMGAREVTKDGFEKTFQVNHLAPFLLTHLLMPALTPGRAVHLPLPAQAPVHDHPGPGRRTAGLARRGHPRQHLAVRRVLCEEQVGHDQRPSRRHAPGPAAMGPQRYHAQAPDVMPLRPADDLPQ